MTTREFRLTISVACETDEVEDAVTASLVSCVQMFNVGATLLAHGRMPRARLTYNSSRVGKVTVDITQPPLTVD